MDVRRTVMALGLTVGVGLSPTIRTDLAKQAMGDFHFKDATIAVALRELDDRSDISIQIAPNAAEVLNTRKVSGLILRDVTFESAFQTLVLIAGLRYEIVDEKTLFVLR